MIRKSRLLIASALVGLICATAIAAVTPAVAADPVEPLALQHARAELAYCLRLQEISTDGTARDTRGRTCARDAQAVIDSYAAPAPTPTNSPTPSPTPTNSPTPSPTPTASPGCALPLYPSAACAGVPAGWTPTRTISGSYTTRAGGEVIDGWRVTGSIDVRHQNVMIRNSEVYGRIYNQLAGIAYNGLIVEDVTIGPPSGNSGEFDGALGVCGYTARRVHIRNAPEGFRVGGYDFSGNRCGPVVIEDSYVRLRSTGGCDHGDGVQELDGIPGGMIVRHNTIDMSGVTCGTAPIYVGDYGGIFTDNLLLGGSHTLRLHQWRPDTHYPRVTGNRIVNGSWDFSPAAVDSCSIIDIWRDNWVVNLDDAGRITLLRSLSSCTETAYVSGSVFA